MNHRDMDKKAREKRRPWRRLRAKQDDTETTQVYTPKDLQALVPKQGNGTGIIRPDTGNLGIPADIDDSGHGQPGDSPLQVMTVIIALAIIFISIIAYFVSQMPVKD